MCTAISTAQFFGRTLDVEYSYDETVTVTPRNFPFSFCRAPHFALCGMAFVTDGFPLYYDAMNEKGLCMAGLHFPQSCRYFPADGIASYELIPWLLSRCATVDDARPLLQNLNITSAPFSPQLPPSPLHWMLADETQALVIESCEDGLHIYENPTGVLTNEPPFPQQLKQLRQHSPHDRGLGLPGDGTSTARFRRAVYGKSLSASESISQFFHIMDLVSLPKGFAKVNGEDHYTVYTSCCDRKTATYHYTTYENRQITGIRMHTCDLDGNILTQFPLIQGEQIQKETIQ